MSNPRFSVVEIVKGQAGGSSLFIILLLLFSFILGAYAGFVYIPRHLKSTPPDKEPERHTATKLEQLPPASVPAADASPGAMATGDKLLLAETPAEDPLAGFKYVEEIAVMYRTGDYKGAVDLLREELRLDPGAPDKEEALAKGINFLAVKKYERGEYLEAEVLLSEAVGLLPDPAIKINLAMAQLNTEKLVDAANTLDSISEDPAAEKFLKDLYSKLGHKFYWKGDVASALTYLEKGLARDPTNEELSALVEKLRAEHEAEGRMTRKEGGHFVVKFDGGENAVAGHLIGLLLEEAYYKVGADLGYYPEDKLEAVLYSKAAFRDVTRSPSWAGAIYDGRVKIPAGGLIEKTAELERVIFHEYTHALVHRLSGGRAPTWLNEGLAQYEEGAAAAWQTEDAAKSLADDPHLTLKRLEGPFSRLSANGAMRAYQASLSATRYLIREFGIGAVMRIFEGLREGKTIEEAFPAGAFLSYEAFERNWIEHLKS